MYLLAIIFWYGNYHRLNIRTIFMRFAPIHFQYMYTLRRSVHFSTISSLSPWRDWIETMRWYAYDRNSLLRNCRRDGIYQRARHRRKTEEQTVDIYIRMCCTILWCVTRCDIWYFPSNQRLLSMERKRYIKQTRISITQDNCILIGGKPQAQATGWTKLLRPPSKDFFNVYFRNEMY